MLSRRGIWDSGTSRRALFPSTVRTLMSENPIDFTLSSAISVRDSMSSVILVPHGMRVARHELEGLSQVSSPASLDSLRTSSFVMPVSFKGDLIPSSDRTLMPGLSSTGSDAFVPSMTYGLPESSAASFMAPIMSFLQL